MKKILKYNLLGLGFLAMTSCMDTLDTHPTEIFDAATVWGSKATVEAFVNSTYASVLSPYLGNQEWEARTPNSAYCSQVGEGIDGIAIENFSATSTDAGANQFSILRRANMIITNVNSSGTLSDAEKQELSAHGYLIRGMIFFNQARKMGRFVPVCEVFDVENPEAVNIPMTSSPAESYKYVIDDLKYAAQYLPESNLPGLPTRYAAGVLLSRAALQAYAYTKDNNYLTVAIDAANNVINNSGVSLSTSSGMFNELDDKNPEILWAYYRLSENTTIGSYGDLIYTYPNITGDDTNNSMCPNPFKNANGQTFNAWAIYFPTQDIVDQFLVTDEATGEALPWYETSQYVNNVDFLDPGTVTTAGQVDSYTQVNGGERRIPSPQDLSQTNVAYDTFLRYHQLKAGSERDLSDLMYTGRDKRFYTAIVYDKGTWLGETIETNLAGNASQGVRDKEDGGWYNTVTGYYWCKGNLANPERAYVEIKVDHHFNLVRLGEAYLNLAEALLLQGKVTEAVAAMNNTRTVHGGLAPSTAATEAEAWADYIRERNCELTNEGGDLYYSYLRWGKYGGDANHGRAAGDIVYDLDRPVYKIQISRDRTKLLIGQLTLLNSASRQFTQKRYLFPIYQGFLNTREAYGLDCAQNEGW